MSAPEVIVDESDGYVDFRFSIADSRVSDAGEAEVTVGGVLLGRPVELRFHVNARILPNDFSDVTQSVHASYDGITMSLTEVTGTNFARAISQLYKSDRSSFHMPLELSFTAVALEGDPAKIASEPVKFKLFHETGSTDDEEGPAYFEMFLNFHLPLGLVYLNEKDTDFRVGVLNAFPPEPN